MPLEEASQFLRALPIVTKKIQIIFRNGIAMIRVLEYNIISYTSVAYTHLDVYKRQSVSRFTGIVGSISLNTAGAQVAAAALFIGFAHPGNRSAVFPALHLSLIHI